VNTISNINDNISEMCVKVISEEIEVNKEYDPSNILSEFIDMVDDISEPDTYNCRVYEHKITKQITNYDDVKSLASRIFSSPFSSIIYLSSSYIRNLLS
jgi:hypothetical protein